jgi:hypothetical protein
MDKKAFPVHPEAHGLKDAQCEALSGMDLRDYFAAKAMQALIGMPGAVVKVADARSHGPHEVVAMSAYVLADAMLIARES